MRSGRVLISARSAQPILLAALAAFLGPAAPAGEEGDSPPAQRPYFVNVAGALGLDAVPAQRAAFVDLDGNGFLDAVLRSASKERATYLFLSRAGDDGRAFEDVTAASRIATGGGDAPPRGANVMIFADVDNDGDTDAFSGIYCDLHNPKFEDDPPLRSAILLNDGKAYFALEPKSGVADPPATTCAAVFLDSDNDGCVDLFVGNWYRSSGLPYDAYPDQLFAGDGKGRFHNATAEAAMSVGGAPDERDGARPTYGAGHCDYNNDGLQDILVCAYGREWNVLWENQGKGRFADAAERTAFDGDAVDHGRYSEAVKRWFRENHGVDRKDERPFRANGNTFSVMPGDFDNDGDMDLLLGEITHAWAGESSDRTSLLVNRGPDGDFAFDRRPDAFPRTHASPGNWNQGDLHVAWLDFDNDGLLDALIASGDYPDGQYLRLFRQNADHTFSDATEACGFDWEGSAGISIGDYDRDGDLDILVGKSWMRLPKERRRGDHPAPALFRNEIGNRNHWITIQLRGRGRGGANALGIGARITVVAGGRTQIREIRGGSGHCGQYDPPEAHFGLGQAETIDRITVRWPNRRLTEQTVEDVPPNRVIRITESRPDYATLFHRAAAKPRRPTDKDR